MPTVTQSPQAIHRRAFMQHVVTVGAATALAPRTAFSATPNERVNLACCGIGHRGADDVRSLHATGLANIVAICDTDMSAPHTREILKLFPDVPRFQDFRRMFDTLGREIDAVSVGVPDFSHFPIAMLAMSLGKHVYCEKPMGHSFRQIELMMAAEKKYNVAAQMGNQGHSEANYFQFKAWVDAGIIKNVTKITAFMNSSRRWHGMEVSGYLPKQPIPDTLDWDSWLSTAQPHDYNQGYVNGDWRSWFDFGNGALGDWGAHIIDTAHEFLNLGLPTEVDAVKLEGHSPYIFPQASTLAFRFPARGTQPPVELTWYDGQNNRPPLPDSIGEEEENTDLPPDADGKRARKKRGPGKVIYGLGRLPWPHAAHHPGGEGTRDGVVAPNGARQSFQPLREFSARLQGRGDMPLVLRGGRTTLSGDGTRGHRPAGECEARVRPGHQANHQSSGRQRSPGRRTAAPGLG